jgi:hypothetical protein
MHPLIYSSVDASLRHVGARSASLYVTLGRKVHQWYIRSATSIWPSFPNVTSQTLWKFNRLSYIIKWLNNSIFTYDERIVISKILFFNRSDEKWPHTHQIKIAGRNHILPPLGIPWKTKHRQLKLTVKLSRMSSTRQSSSYWDKNSIRTSKRFIKQIACSRLVLLLGWLTLHN